MSDRLNHVIIKTTRSANRKDLIDLYKDAGWWQPSYDKNNDFLDLIVSESSIFAGAFIGDQLIGMGRVLSDMCSDAYIQDVVVLKRYRRQGIAGKIIKLLVQTLEKEGVDWIGLIAQPGTDHFYQGTGFEILKDHIPMKYKG